MTSKRSLAAPINKLILLGCFLLLSMVQAFAQSSDDLYAKGTAAVGKGDAIGARDAFCAIKDASYKDAKAQCTTYTGEATRQMNRYNQNYLEGLQLMQDGKLNEAEFKFRNVKAGDRMADAQRKLQEVADLKQKKAAADAAASQNAASDSASKTRLDAGVEAFNRGDFNAAKNQLDGVSGRYQGEAQNYLNRINNYNAKMSEGRGYEAAKNFGAAKAAYSAAAVIKADGPGDPLGAVTRVTAAEVAGSGSAPAAPVKPLVREIPKIDVGNYLAEGRKAAAKGDFKKARRFFNDVIAQDFKNVQAREGLDALPKEEVAKGGSVGEAEPILASAILKYYRGNLSDSEDQLKYYCVQQVGKKEGMCKFYLGVILATRYYLGGGTDNSLLSSAKGRFKEASAVSGFVVPEKLVSPKVLKLYQEEAAKAKPAS